ncbi:hypothetical protein NDU88_004901 [Pleurodeles waltl]|uniref:Myb/SANT-like DNA-binding domain-containing protein n=1 Tax=Pleurodeles waltl TaxID=8319 RepID=A0AAV7WX98_PLEWA|nr:hypothetical protein NDU88_004901 [Pleurodeles waltl]
MPPSPHMSQRTVPMKDNSEQKINQLRATYTQLTQNTIHNPKFACMSVEARPSVEETMARASGERASAFTSEELEKLMDGVLPQYTLLYGPPDKQVSAHQKKDVWRAIAKDVQTLGVYHRWSNHCSKRWEDIRRWSKKMAEAQLGMASQRGRGVYRTMTPLMFRILLVAYLELDGCLRHHSSQKGSPRARLSRSQPSTSATTSPGPVVPVVTGFWSAPGCRAASVARSHSTDSPPPVKHQKLASARRERGKTPATKAAPRGTGGSVESAVTPSKVGKGHRKLSKSGKTSTAEKTAISPAAQEATAIIPAAQEATAIIPAGPERTTSTSLLGQIGPPAPLGQTGPSPAPLAQKGPAAPAPLCQKGPPAPAPLGQTGPPAAESLPRTPPQQAPLKRTPPQEAPLSRTLPPQAPLPRTPPPQAPLPRTLLPQAPLAHERQGH